SIKPSFISGTRVASKENSLRRGQPRNPAWHGACGAQAAQRVAGEIYMTDQATAMSTIFTEFYFFLCIVLMFIIHIGFCMYEVGVARTNNVQHTLLKNAMAIPTIGLCFYLCGMSIYIALQAWPVGSPEVS